MNTAAILAGLKISWPIVKKAPAWYMRFQGWRKKRKAAKRAKKAAKKSAKG